MSADLAIPAPEDFVPYERYTYRQLDQCRQDDIRITHGLAPMHPELSEYWPDIYGRR